MDIVETVVNIAKQEGIVDCSLDGLKTGDGQGYMGVIDFVHLNGKTKCGKEKKISFAIKTAASNKTLRETPFMINTFEREFQMYKSVFPALYNFEKEKGIKNPLPSVPKCYSVFDKTVPEILILEDLIQSGYKTWDRMLMMDDRHVRIVVQEYARFHSVSFAIQDQHPVQFVELTKNLDNIFDKYMKGTGIFDAAIRKCKLALASLDSNSKAFARYKLFLSRVEQEFSDLMATCSKYYVILHGDGWCNNMLFKYNKVRMYIYLKITLFLHPNTFQNSDNLNEPVAMRLLDFQFSRLGSPVSDLSYFLYSCTSKEVLDNMNAYKYLYYDTLCKHIELLGSNPNNLYPISVFEEHWKMYSKFGFIWSSLLVFLLLSEKHEIIDFTDIVETGKEIGTAFDYEIANTNEFNGRMESIIKHFVENNII